MNTAKIVDTVKSKVLFIFLFLTLAMLLISFDKKGDGPVNDGKFVVVLDAGHGGHDPGNLGNGYLEKNIALNIVLKIGAILEKNEDIKVVYTRKDDTFVDLYVRGEIANKANANLFVSVHCDSHTSDAHGAGTFVLGLHASKQNFEIAKKENSVIYLEDNYKAKYADYDINSPESIIGLTIMQEEFLDQSIALAKAIQDNFSGKLNRVDRKVKQAGFIVLHQTFMPSVLVETGFLTNKEEGKYLNSSQGQSEMGIAIAEAILKYKNGVQSNIAPDVANSQAIAEAEIPQVEKSNVQEAVKAGVVETVKSEEKPSEIKKEVPKEVVKEARNAKEGENSGAIKKGQSAEANSSSNKGNILFKVQLLASAKEIQLVPGNFNGLGALSKEPHDNLYRYMYGSTHSYREAQMLKSNADLKGFPSSYIVAYRDGVRIPVPEALKYVSE